MTTTTTKPPPAPSTPSSNPASSADLPVVLLVDDDADVRETAAVWLAGEGFRVVTASGGREAMAVVRETPPAVVVLDLLMPDITGWDVWDWLQQNNHRVPVVVWTASGLRTGAVGDAPIVSKNHPHALALAIHALVGRIRG